MLQEFREFISRGNVMDMAVGIIVGAAFTAIVSSLVADLINPIIGLIIGGIDFSNMFLVLGGSGDHASLQAARDAGAAVFAYGSFIMAVINFLIIAFVVFLLVKGVNRVKEAAERKAKAEATEEAPAGPSERDILIEIRDALRMRDTPPSSPV
ncbi:large conductance mechanosensitive channel protein MscL [Tranquillimonas rosea]|uniref:large conductance mechanosensitive channel protein MscL n=1 Tax=Tranquillimonas rosea TaxID=641238 RepID=UPI003BAA790B